MKLPNTLKIGPITYEVREIGDLHSIVEGQRQWLHGAIVWKAAEIHIAHDQVDEVKVTSLMHEALHGILNNAGQNDQPEEMILALGYGVVQLLRDNPALVSLIVGEEQS